MRKLIAISILVAACLLGGCRGRGVVADTGFTGSVFQVSETNIRSGKVDILDLGRVKEGEVVTRDFALKNAGNTPIAVMNISTSCGCLTFNFGTEPIAPGAEKIVTVRADLRGFHGTVSRKVLIHTSISEKPHTIYVEAYVH